MQDVNTLFGPDEDVTAYNTIAAKIAQLRPRALSVENYEDVIVMLEYMRDECLRLHERCQASVKSLAEREARVQAQEKESAIRRRAIDAATKTHEHARSRLHKLFWR